MRTRRIASIAVIALLLALVVNVFVVEPIGLTAQTGRTPALLPRELSGPALTTVSAADHAAGQSAMIANYPDRPVVGDILGTQNVVVGPGNSYRTVPGRSLLDPDGTHVLMPGTDGTLTRLNLTDKSSRRYDVRTETDGLTRALAVAPDGNTVLYGTTPDRGSEFVVSLHLLDLRTGTASNLRTPARAAAFSPDGTTIAVDTGGTVSLLAPSTGSRTPSPYKGRLAGDDAWSPDGRLLAYQKPGEPTLVLASDTETVTLEEVGTFLGWRDATTVLVYDHQGHVRAANLDGTTKQVMGMPEFSGISDVAGALVPRLAFGDAGAPDHGPLLVRFRWPLLAATVLVLLAAVLAARPKVHA